jgi:carbohydrate-selective porin OprB
VEFSICRSREVRLCAGVLVFAGALAVPALAHAGQGPATMADTAASRDAERTDEGQQPYSLPEQDADFHPSRGLHCDVMKHLKTPRTYRRLDAYMRPTAFTAQADDSVWTRDFATGDWGGERTRLYKKGIDLYGCIDFDFAYDLVSNTSSNPLVAPAPTYRSERNYVQTYGGDFYSRLWSKTWQGGQFHWSVTWPQTRPLYAYRNRLTGVATGQIHGQFYTETGLGGDTELDQGFRLFELWFQQTYGPHHRNYVRFGNIFPLIQISRTILSDLFNFWTFGEPCMLGTTYGTGNAPCFPVAPLGFQVDHVLNDTWEISGQVMQGYYNATGRSNTRGVDFDIPASDGLEGILEVTKKGGTYSLDANDHGKPWMLKLGVQLHSGPTWAINQDDNGDPPAISGLPKKVLHGNSQVYVSYEHMLYREPGSYGKGLTVFAKGGTGFYEDRNVVKNWLATGAGYEGLFARRDRDVLFAGVAVLKGTQSLLDAYTLIPVCVQVPGCNVTPRQVTYEAGYSFELTPWLYATPMIQYIRNPSMRTDLGNITTFGFTSKVAF